MVSVYPENVKLVSVYPENVKVHVSLSGERQTRVSLSGERQSSCVSLSREHQRPEIMIIIIIIIIFIILFGCALNMIVFSCRHFYIAGFA